MAISIFDIFPIQIIYIGEHLKNITNNILIVTASRDTSPIVSSRRVQNLDTSPMTSFQNNTILFLSNTLNFDCSYPVTDHHQFSPCKEFYTLFGWVGGGWKTQEGKVEMTYWLSIVWLTREGERKRKEERERVIFIRSHQKLILELGRK